MLPWHAIPFLKALGMLTPKPLENGWPRLWRSCNWQKNTQLNHSMAPKEPYRHSKWADVSPLLKYISGAVAPRLKAPKGPYQASYSKANRQHRYRITNLDLQITLFRIAPGRLMCTEWVPYYSAPSKADLWLICSPIMTKFHDGGHWTNITSFALLS